jgi:hypothetical protein
MLEAALPINNIFISYFDVMACGTAWYIRLVFAWYQGSFACETRHVTILVLNMDTSIHLK